MLMHVGIQGKGLHEGVISPCLGSVLTNYDVIITLLLFLAKLSRRFLQFSMLLVFIYTTHT